MNRSAVFARALTLLVAVAAATLTGCASQQTASTRNRDPDWTKQMVAGSRIARRLDSFGKPATGTLVQTITDENLQAMPGNSLGAKLSGNSSGF
jgi:hypothetical protein